MINTRENMKKGKRSLVLGMAVMLLVTGNLTGCGEKVTVESLLEETAENFQKVESMEGSFDLDVNLQIENAGVSMTLGIGMDGDIQMTNQPAAMHVDGNLNMDLLGFQMAMELYTVETDGRIDTYVKAADQWTKVEEQKEEQKVETTDLADLLEEAPILAEKTEQWNGEDVYVISGKLNGEQIENQLAPLKEKLGEDYKKIDFSKADIPVTMKIYKENRLPAAFELDMGTFIDSFLKTMSSEEVGNMAADSCLFTLTFGKYNSVGTIKVPEEALGAEEENLFDMESEKTEQHNAI